MTGEADDRCASNDSGGVGEAAERRYRKLLEHSPDPMCVHADGRVVYVNPAGVRGIGAQSADDIVGRMITDFVHPDSIPPMLVRIAALQREGDSSLPSEAVMLRLDGSPVDAEVVSVLTTWDGRPAYQVIFRDLTLLKAAEETLRYQAALVTHATDAIIATTLTGAVSSWNRAAEAIYQRPAANALALPISEAVGATVNPATIVANGGVEHATHRAADGTTLHVRVAAAAMDSGYVLVCSDHTALRRAERRFHTVVNSLEEGVVVLDQDGRPEWLNPAARRILGVQPDATTEESARLALETRLLDRRGRPLGGGYVERVLADSRIIRNEILGVDRPDGERRWLVASCRPLDEDGPGGPTMLASFTDITDQHNTHLSLNYQARHDSLTGLPNRAYAEAQISRTLQAPSPDLAAVLFIDLDNVKSINDGYGHHAGDAVIRAAAHRLRATLRADDFVARMGGDEFVALIFGHTDRQALDDLTARLQTALSAPLDVAGHQWRVTASIGVVQVDPKRPRTAAEILRDADAAMYRAKARRAATHYADDTPATAYG
jgi:diguanylate cyclase (GGDEF)-like protein/PAS domain S-box-containing protein